ncbi:YigZ family protein [Metamycoplasma hominis]|nr:YigZ family protein [Metamycoplasma hominis]
MLVIIYNNFYYNKTMAILEIKKSKFISYKFNIKSKDDVKLLKEQLKNQHQKARHIVYAYLVIENGVQCGGMSDDGEPSGTAGKPLYFLLERNKLNNCVLFVVRYFGGIKLGASKLIRTYSKVANDEIKSSNQ